MTVDKQTVTRLKAITAAPVGWAAYYGQSVGDRDDATMLPVVAWAVDTIPKPWDAEENPLYDDGPELRPVAIVTTADGRLLTAAEAAVDGQMELLTIAYGLDGNTLPAQVHAWAGRQTVERIRDAHGR